MAGRFVRIGEASGRLVTYVIVGGVVSALYAGLVIGFVEIVRLSPLAASLASFLIALPASYCAHANFTFGDKPKTRETRGRYVAITASSFLCATLAMYVIHDSLRLHYGFGILGIWILVPLANYTIHLAWTFREHDGPHNQTAPESSVSTAYRTQTNVERGSSEGLG